MSFMIMRRIFIILLLFALVAFFTIYILPQALFQPQLAPKNFFISSIERTLDFKDYEATALHNFSKTPPIPATIYSSKEATRLDYDLKAMGMPNASLFIRGDEAHLCFSTLEKIVCRKLEATDPVTQRLLRFVRLTASPQLVTLVKRAIDIGAISFTEEVKRRRILDRDCGEVNFTIDLGRIDKDLLLVLAPFSDLVERPKTINVVECRDRETGYALQYTVEIIDEDGKTFFSTFTITRVKFGPVAKEVFELPAPIVEQQRIYT